MDGLLVQRLERIARILEKTAGWVRDSIKPDKKGVFLVKSKMGYGVVVDGFDLGIDTGWGDADKLCRLIASRRPGGEEMGYGHNINTHMPKGDEITMLAAKPRKEEDGNG